MASQFKVLTRKDASRRMSASVELLMKKISDVEKRKTYEDDLRGFKQLYDQYVSQSEHHINWETMKPVSDSKIINNEDLPKVPKEKMKELLNTLVVVKLNGGLGTSMGCVGPKSLITVRSDFTFLDLTVRQIDYINKTYDVDVPLILMNSFNTHKQTQEALLKYSFLRCSIRTFVKNMDDQSFYQFPDNGIKTFPAGNRYPRINKETMLPLINDLENPNLENWYPPGHGDFYAAFSHSGLLEDCINEGKELCFLSNIDNLGATVNVDILNFLLNGNQKHEFLMEVTDKTRADVKGGTLVECEDTIRLLEIAQVPPEHVDEFKSVKLFRIFNTNNLWIDLKALKRVINDGSLNLEIIVNPKSLDDGTKVIQLETACGAAVKCFKNSIGLNVPRKRFLPVKKTSDLLLVKSDLYEMDHGFLEMSPFRMFSSTPLIKLGDDNFSKINDFIKRIESVPNIMELDHLTISGDVTLGKHVTLKGTVIIIANQGSRIDIPDYALLENKIVSGNLRILPH